MVVSIGHLAYFSLVLKYGIQDASGNLNPHFLRNFSIYEKALLRAKSLALLVPKKARAKEIAPLVVSLQSQLTGTPNWKKVHFEILAYLLVFDAQLERNDKRNLGGGRWIHAEVHCRAIYFVKVENGINGDKILLRFIKDDEIELVSKFFADISKGQSFSSTVKSRRIKPHGIREILRVLLEIQESLFRILPLSEREKSIKVIEALREWREDLDPEAALLRIRGIILESQLRKLMQKIKDDQKRKKFENENRKELLGKLRAQRKVRSFDVTPGLFQTLYALAFILVNSLLFLNTPQDAYSFGIAWWYFEVGVLVSGVALLFAPFIMGTLENAEFDIESLLCFIGTCGGLLWLINPNTYHFGIAWWHTLLGMFLTGMLILLLSPVLKSVVLKTKLRVVF
jgi:hypothetical protein